MRMAEMRIPEVLCGYLNTSELGDFIPEVWRDGCAAVWLTGGETIRVTYIDGSRVIGVPFEIRVRCAGRTIADRLDAVEFFRAVNEFLRTTPLTANVDGVSDCAVTPVGSASKSAVYEDGSEEYRAAFLFCYTETA